MSEVMELENRWTRKFSTLISMPDLLKHIRQFLESFFSFPIVELLIIYA
jgi:hypothetical protein